MRSSRRSALAAWAKFAILGHHAPSIAHDLAGLFQRELDRVIVDPPEHDRVDCVQSGDRIILAIGIISSIASNLSMLSIAGGFSPELQ
jgi:hypothetical protein